MRSRLLIVYLKVIRKIFVNILFEKVRTESKLR